MMTKINLDELHADREAGTAGPWQSQHDFDMDGEFTIIGNIDGETIDGHNHYTYDTVAEVYDNGSIAKDRANARRIARLPDLEAAYIEAVELLKNAMTIVENCTIEDGVCCCGDDMNRHSDPMSCGHSPMDHGSYVASQFHDAARALLERNT